MKVSSIPFPVSLIQSPVIKNKLPVMRVSIRLTGTRSLMMFMIGLPIEDFPVVSMRASLKSSGHGLYPLCLARLRVAK